MPDDLEAAHAKWCIHLARHGDGKPLVSLLRSGEPIRPKLRNLLAAIVAGRIKLRKPLPKTRTYEGRHRRWLRERAVIRMVDFEMRSDGKQRDTQYRTSLTREWCDYYGTTPNRVADYLRYGRTAEKRRRDLHKIAALKS